MRIYFTVSVGFFPPGVFSMLTVAAIFLITGTDANN